MCVRQRFCDFKSGYINDIQKVKAPCLDQYFAELPIDEIDRFINEIEEMKKDPSNQFLLLNFDGFGRRLDKGMYKTAYIVKKCHKKLP